MVPAAVTIVARNYIPFARVLCDSFLKHHPDGRFFVFLVDELQGAFDPAGERFELVEFDSLDLPRGELFRYQYSVLELSTAVKPFLLRHLLDKHNLESILYLDPDLYIKAPLTSILKALERASIVLTPHMFTPPPDDGMSPSETDIMHSGVYNLGFLGVRNNQSVSDLLDWWSNRLTANCVVDLPNAVFVDQRWMDLAPSYFDGVEILRDPALNVAYWNLHERELSLHAGQFHANGVPLVFFHFSGFHPRNNSTLSKHQTRHTLKSNSALESLAAEYGAELLAGGYDEFSKIPNAFSILSNNVQLGRLTQFVVRRAADMRVNVPSPKEDPDSFCRFLMTPNYLFDKRAIAPILVALEHYRADVRTAFPGAFESPYGARSIMEWVRNSGGREENLAQLFKQYGHLLDRVGTSQLALKVWRARKDLQEAFPRAFDCREGSEKFAKWIERYGTAESDFSVGDGAVFLSRRNGLLRVLMLYFQDPNLQKEFPFLFVDSIRERFVEWLYLEACPRNIVAPEDVSWFEGFAQCDRDTIAAITLGHSAWLQGNLVGGGTIYDLRNVRDLLGSHGASISEQELVQHYCSEAGRSLLAQAEQYYLYTPEVKDRFPKAFGDVSVFDRYIGYLALRLGQRASGQVEPIEPNERRSGFLARVKAAVAGEPERLSEAARPVASSAGDGSDLVVARLTAEADAYRQADFGINLAGYFHALTGMGESARSMFRTLEAGGVACNKMPLPSYHLSRSIDVEYLFRGELIRDHNPAYKVNLVVANGDDYRHVRSRLPYAFWQDRKNIGYWVWETEELPREGADCGGLAEIWTPSEYSASAIRKAVDIPVHVVPHVLDFEEIDASVANARKFGIPEGKVVYGFFWDCKSVVERKNPQAALNAFRQAFGLESSNTMLVFKVGSPEFAPQEFAKLKQAAQGLDVLWITETLSRTDTLSLMKSLDVYVSLHRSEGFGLTCAEAMAMGKPVVASDYSGNVDFMDSGNSLLIPTSVYETKLAHGPYPAGTRWGDPDVEVAADALRSLLDQRRRTEIGEKAQRSIRRRLHPATVAETVLKLLQRVDPKSKSVVYLKRPAQSAAGK